MTGIVAPQKNGAALHGHFMAIAIVFLSVSGCSDRTGILGTHVGDQMRVQRTSGGPEATLKAAVFAVTSNQTREQAITTLTDDDAKCRENTCVWSFVERETWLDTKVGIRPPGPRRAWRQEWRVRFLNERVTSADDIDAEVKATKLD